MFRRFGLSLISFLFVGSAFALEIGDSVPCLDIETLKPDGTRVEQCVFKKEQEGQYVIVDFFQTNCVFCQRNLPGLSELAKATEGKAVTRSVGLDRKPEAIIAYVEKNRNFFFFDVVLDSQRVVSKAFSITGTPTTYVIGPDDTVVYKHEGLLQPVDLGEIRKLVGAE